MGFFPLILSATCVMLVPYLLWKAWRWLDREEPEPRVYDWERDWWLAFQMETETVDALISVSPLPAGKTSPSS